ncbi:MAG TPA: aldehyde dehydrogenase (NADP(+)) [Chthoniobacterales bacterium]
MNPNLDKFVMTAAERPPLPPAERAQFLHRIAETVEALGEPLIELCSAETALASDRLRGERARTVNQLRMFADLVEEGSWVDARIDTALPDRKPVPKPDLRRILRPLGPVAVFSASNFPLAFSVAGGDTASALAAGNPVVVKPHPGHPGTSRLVGQAVSAAAEQSGAGNWTFHLLDDSSVEAGAALVQHPAIRGVSFTGSLPAGRALFDLAARRPEPIPVFAEMGCLNPLVVLPGALRARGEAIVRALTGSVTVGVGQFCTKPGLVLGLTGAELDGFCQQLGAALEQVPPGQMLYPGIADRFEASLQGVAEFSSHAGGGHLLRADSRAFRDHPKLREEIFGPATLVVGCDDEADLLQTLRGLAGQLTATVHLEPAEFAAGGPLIEILQLKAGRLIVNGYPTGVEVCPSMQHGGPYPATTDPRFTSVGTAAIQRFARPVCYQNFPENLLPPELRDRNARGIWRLINGQLTKDHVGGSTPAAG